MAWKEVGPMEERIRFVLKATREEMAFTDLCSEFGISRRTGYKWLRRYEDRGLEGMHELSRRPLTSPMRIEKTVEDLVLRERRKHGKWGPKKLREKLVEKYDGEEVPAVSTIGNIIRRHGLTKKKQRKRPVSEPDRTTQTEPTRPNEVWGVDFKGWFKTKDGSRCDPLTCSDLSTRFVLICRIVDGQRMDSVKPEFRKTFIRYGLPEAIRVDNGSPFGSRGVCGLSHLSAWWVRLGIRVEFIEPGHPEQNGVHERMHRTLKEETARPPAATLKAQQYRFDRWRRDFNYERPHEALEMQRPAQRYERSPRRYTGNPVPFEYPLHYEIRMVKTHGGIKWRGQFYYVGEAFRGMALGLIDIADRIYGVYFGDLLLGYIEEEKAAEGLRPPGAGDLPREPGHGV